VGVTPLDALKTYRYLRLGIIAAVLALAASLVSEIRAAHCLLGSISAYYYTPVRAIFVGAMLMVGFALIAYKGRDWLEDLSLNLAGIFAPLVAIAPTLEDISAGPCKSTSLTPSPVEFVGTPHHAQRIATDWVVANINNNVTSLLFVGFVAVILAFVVWRLNLAFPALRRDVQPWTGAVLAGTFVILAGIALFKHYRPITFVNEAHGKAAPIFFVFLWVTIVANVRLHWRADGRPWVRTYSTLAVLMVAGLAIPGSYLWFKHQGRPWLFWHGHEIFWLEAWEITVFAVYWIAQTWENWTEHVVLEPDDAALLETA
jgi:hypothetical protein